MIILGLIGVHALIFRRSVYNRTEELDRLPITPPNVKVAAILSLVLWTAMFTMGRLIAYWEKSDITPPKSRLKGHFSQITVESRPPVSRLGKSDTRSAGRYTKGGGEAATKKIARRGAAA